MAGVSTVALLERKQTISRSLFSRYWRDVHGVMAARIPGFESYTQHHVTPLTHVGSIKPEAVEGIAVVTYACEADRAGLIESAITQHIHRDEQNVFRRALLYNLPEGASQALEGKGAAGSAFEYFLVVPEGLGGKKLAAALLADGATGIMVHDLGGGDPSGWNDTDVDDGGQGRLFGAVIHAGWASEDAALAGIRAVVTATGGAIAAYRLDERHIMVDQGRPTPVGLRGLDAVRTIEEAGAVNQLDAAVVEAIYGKLGTA